MWKFTGQQRPDFAIAPGPNQESVWDYPRPPALVDCALIVTIRDGDTVIASSSRAKRVLETASPPTVYIPPDDIHFEHLEQVAGSSFCEWKGAAEYWAVKVRGGQPVGWSYPEPKAAFADIRDWLCFYPNRIDCYLGDEQVRGQGGGFYGGWVTASIVGPWKGDMGSNHW